MPAVMIYVQHLLGIGHLMRARLIAEALADAGSDVHLVSGGMPIGGRMPRGRARRATAADPGLGRELHAAARRRLRAHRRRVSGDAGATCCSPPSMRRRPAPSSSKRSRSAGGRCASSSCRCWSASTRRARGRVVVASVRDILQIQQKPEREREMLELGEDLVRRHPRPRRSPLRPLRGDVSAGCPSSGRRCTTRGSCVARGSAAVGEGGRRPRNRGVGGGRRSRRSSSSPWRSRRRRNRASAICAGGCWPAPTFRTRGCADCCARPVPRPSSSGRASIFRRCCGRRSSPCRRAATTPCMDVVTQRCATRASRPLPAAGKPSSARAASACASSSLAVVVDDRTSTPGDPGGGRRCGRHPRAMGRAGISTARARRAARRSSPSSSAMRGSARDRGQGKRMSAWQRLDAELDAWRDGGRRADLWCRDDDACRDFARARPAAGNCAGRGGSRRARRHPGAARARSRRCGGASPIRDGRPARLCAPQPRAAGRAQLGAGEPAAGEPDARRARRGPRAASRVEFRPAFPPRAGPALESHRPAAWSHDCPRAGFAGLSTFGPRAGVHPVPGLVQCNTHVDLIAWRRDRAFIGVDAAIDRLVLHLESRRAGVGDAAEPTGILTHHLDLDAPAWAFLADLFARTRDHGAATWLDVDAAFAVATQRRRLLFADQHEADVAAHPALAGKEHARACGACARKAARSGTQLTCCAHAK